jgi:hypothetical protein
VLTKRLLPVPSVNAAYQYGDRPRGSLWMELMEESPQYS